MQDIEIELRSTTTRDRLILEAKYWSVHLLGWSEWGDMNAVWKRDFDRDRQSHPTLLSLSMLTPRVLLKQWFLLHSVTAHSAIKYALLLPLLPLPDTEHPEILSSSPAKRRWSVKLELLSGRQSGGRPSYSTPSTLSSDRSQLKPFRSWQNLADRQIPTHTVEWVEEVDIFL